MARGRHGIKKTGGGLPVNRAALAVRRRAYNAPLHCTRTCPSRQARYHYRHLSTMPSTCLAPAAASSIPA